MSLMRTVKRDSIRIRERVGARRRLGGGWGEVLCRQTQWRWTSMVGRQTIFGRPVERTKSGIGGIDGRCQKRTMSRCWTEMGWCRGECRV